MFGIWKTNLGIPIMMSAVGGAGLYVLTFKQSLVR
jgi:hypothetical protein